MPRIEEQIHIEARPMDVFRLCHDMDRRSEWDERVGRAKVLTPKPVRRGTVVRMDARPPRGAVFSWEGEFSEFTFPRQSKIVVIDAAPSSHFVDGSETWSFRRADGGTDVSLLWEYKPRGLVGRLLDPLMRRGAIRRAISQSLENLKETVERAT